MEMEKELTLAAKVENLDTVNEFVASFIAPLAPSPKAVMQLDLVVEELFVNVASYAYETEGDFTLRGKLDPAEAKVELKFIDAGKPYNPLEKAEPDLDLSLEERDIGGLGIFLVKKNVDDIEYQRSDGQNILTIRKRLS
ncbi:MAG: ATP-binding protein [Selenomonadaceae bacterium]|nr:ATP-binding protein [Selenomonadaceae bacterium]